MQFKRIYIKNFQSIKEIELLLEENRCYHVKGDNNIGKSAFLKAIEAVVRNVSSRNVDKHIRDGADSFYIEISDFNNNVIRLSRGKEDYYSWDIDGVSGRVDGTAGKVPDEVRAFFNFYEDMEKSKEIVNIRPPRSRLLFIDTTNAENYYLLQKALKIEEYLAAIKLGDGKKRENKKEVQVIIDRIEETNEEIGKLKDYGVILKELELYEFASEDVYNSIVDLKEVDNLMKEIDRKEDFIDKNSITFNKEETKDLVDKIKLLSGIISLQKEIDKKESSVKEKMQLIQLNEDVKVVYNQLIDCKENVKLVKEKEIVEFKVSKTENSIENKENILRSLDGGDLSTLISNIKDGNSILQKGTEVRERMTRQKELNLNYETAEENRKQFMIENKFCPVVLSMRDRKCPFSGKTLEELLL